MPVENVFDPPVIDPQNPRMPGKPVPDDVATLKNEVTKAQARRELAQETQLTNQLLNPPAEPPLKVSGSINLGDFNLQAQQDQERQKSETQQRESREREDRLRDENTQLRDQVHQMGIQQLQATLMQQIENLKTTIAASQVAPPDLVSQLSTIEALAAKLGYHRPEAAAPSGDVNSLIVLEKLRAEIKRDERRFQQEMKKDERMWQIEMLKLNQTTQENQAKVNAEKHKWDTISALPEQIGGAIVRGLMAQPDQEPAPQQQRTRKQTQQQQVPEVYEVSAKPGEAGEINCPTCETLVGIAPRAKEVACSDCGQKFEIIREGEDTTTIPPMERVV